jgi:hypothetical protein
MTVKVFTVTGASVVGIHRARRGRDSIRVTGTTTYEIYADINGVNLCEQLIGKDHIKVNHTYPILRTASGGVYLITTAEDAPSEATNGKLKVGTRSPEDPDDDEDDDADDDPDDEALGSGGP